MGKRRSSKGADLSKLEDLIKILNEQNMKNESQQISLLIGEMHEMKENYNTVFRELNTIKEQLIQLQNLPQVPEKQSVIVNQLATFENNVQDQYKQIQSMGEKMNEKAADLIQKFKDIGIKALDNVCNFLGIKENIIKMRDVARSNAETMRRSIAKIESIGNEVKDASVHIRNIGRAAAGKDLIDPASAEQFKIFQKMKSSYQKQMDTFENRAKSCSICIEKLETLEKTANRASVRKKLDNNKKVIEAKEGSEPKLEKEKPLQLDVAR